MSAQVIKIFSPAPPIDAKDVKSLMEVDPSGDLLTSLVDSPMTDDTIKMINSQDSDKKLDEAIRLGYYHVMRDLTLKRIAEGKWKPTAEYLNRILQASLAANDYKFADQLGVLNPDIYLYATTSFGQLAEQGNFDAINFILDRVTILEFVFDDVLKDVLYAVAKASNFKLFKRLHNMLPSYNSAALEVLFNEPKVKDLLASFVATNAEQINNGEDDAVTISEALNSYDIKGNLQLMINNNVTMEAIKRVSSIYT